MKIIISTPLLAISLLIIGTASAQSNTYSPENCGNGIIDAGEQCDSGELNSNNLNVASFCNKECKFYKFLDKKLYFKCQINDNIPAKRNLYCRGKFYQYAQSCEIEAGETECVSEYPLLPLNSDERHYKKDLTGTLDDHELVNTAYNGTYYFLNFKLNETSSDIPPPLPEQSPPPSGGEYSCRDTDNGRDFYRIGRVFYRAPEIDGHSVDTCISSNMLSEQFCVNDQERGHTIVTCHSGCRDGVCLPDSKTKTKISNKPKPVPPAGYEDEVLVNTEAYDNPFPDTSLASIEGKAAAELYRRAVIGGFPDGEFKGNRHVNRAEAAKFLLLARFDSVANTKNDGKFPDVLNGQWYTKYVVTAANKKIINGHPDGTFKPADTVNTAEFLKMLSLTFELQLNLPYSYTDISSSDWFSPYAGIAERYELFPERSQSLNPGDPLTREEVAVAIYQYMQNR